MAQVGRISGPLLEENLLRKGTSNSTAQDDLKFRNTNSDPVLLKLDVTNGRIGIDVDAPANELHISNTTRTIDLIGDTAGIANFTFSNNRIDSDSGPIYLNAGEHIQATNLETEQFYISDNFILTHNTNTNIDLKPHGTGILDIHSNLEVFGNMHSTGNITFDGNVVFGDQDTDTVDFNADVRDDIIPNITDTYKIGKLEKNWSNLYTNLVNGQLVTSGAINVGNMFLDSRQGGIFYVAKGGDNTNVGDHPQGPLLTIEEAISRCDASTAGPVTILVYPGVYQESFPLEVPARVSIKGVDLRNTIVIPTVATQDNDAFHLNDSSTITDITIKDFYYNSTNNTGHAFRFAPGAVITNRSPYLQNVTVITKGSTITVDDPRGFASGDAGRGAWIDGSELDSASIEASMLFHSCTFITPNADVISMTNGVRVEWLNSFTYFANRGLYAFNGVTGRTTYDGSTVEYGAEVRSIGSANVYGNYGAVADGADTLMYLIQHNMAYIGAGKFVDNDASRAIYANETVELNSGKIHYTTTDHLGGFRIGDNFWVDFETGNTTINIDTLSVNQFNALRVITGGNTTIIDGAYIETGNLEIRGNNIVALSGDLNIASATGQINLQDNVGITGNLDITGNFSYGGSLNIKGDELTDSLTFNAQIEQDFNPNQHLTFDLGSFTNRWLIAHLDRVEVNNFSIYDNVIETNISNADLELRANGTGEILIPNNDVQIDNNLTVNGLTTINSNVSITSNPLPVTGDINQTGNFSVTGNANIQQNIEIGASVSLKEILIDDNFITTTTSNADLELRAAGTGIVNLQTNVNVDNNLSANDVDTTNVTVTLNTTSDNANIGNVEINDNYIETTSVNGDLTLSSTRNVIVTDTDVRIVNDLTVSTDTSLQDTTITGTLAHTGAYNQTGNYTIGGELTVDNVYVEDNFITTTTGNLVLEAAGTGTIFASSNNVAIANNLDIDGVTNLDDTNIAGNLTQIGDTNQIGNYDIAGELTVDNVYVEDNFITTTTGNLILGATGDVNVDINDVEIANNLTVGGLTTLQNTSITGTISHVGDKTQTGNYTIAGEISNGNILIEDNFITTTNSNSDLELRSSGTGNILISNNTQIDNNLTVSSTTSLQNTSITGTLTHVGDRNITPGTYTLAGFVIQPGVYGWTFDLGTNTNTLTYDSIVVANFVGTQSSYVVGADTYNKGTVSDINGNIETYTIEKVGDLKLVEAAQFTQTGNLDITGQVNFQGDVQFTDINISDNVITTTIGNSDLDLRAAGTGEVLINGTNLRVSNNLFAASITTTDINVAQDLILDEINIRDSNIEINDNYITTSTSNSNLELRATGNVVYKNNTIIDNNLTVNGTSSISSGTISGDLLLTGNRTQVGNYNLIGNLNISSLVTDQEFQFDDVKIHGNVLETTLSNSNLDLRAAGTGKILFNDQLRVYNNLTTSTFNVNSISVDDNVALETIELSTDVQFFDNVITTTNSNSNLELRANGTGNIFLQELSFNGNIVQTDTAHITFTPLENLIVDSTSALVLPNGLTSERIITQDTFLEGGDSLVTGPTLDGGNASTIFGASDTIYNSGGSILVSSGNLGDLRFNTTDNVFEGTSVSGTVTFNGVYSANRLTSVTADPTSNNIRFIVNGAENPLDSTNLVGEISGTGLEIHGLRVDSISANNNTITTISNANLELAPNGTGEVSFGDISIKDNLIKNNGNNLLLKGTNFGKYKFSGAAGVVVPSGLSTERPAALGQPNPQIGDTRWNTTLNVLETWNGTEYISSAGIATAITPQEFDDLLLEYTLIFG